MNIVDIKLQPSTQPQKYLIGVDFGDSPDMSRLVFPCMYALSKKGQIRTYSVTVDDDGSKATITTGKRVSLNGKWTYDRYEYTCGVNIGKSNETTYFQQAVNDALSIISKLKDEGYTERMPKDGDRFNTDADGSIKPMLAIGFSQKQIRFPCIVQPKYDGVRCLVFEQNGEVQIKSRKGKPYNIPHLREWAESHRDMLPLDGELYNHNELTFQEIVSAVKRHSDITPKIRYAVYDKPVLGFGNMDRLNMLVDSFSNLEKDSPVYLSEYSIAESIEDVYALHDRYVADGYEGAIIRNTDGIYEFGFRSSNLIKLKSFKDSEYEIVDVIEASGRDAGTAIFVCRCDAGDFNVKPQGTRETRAGYFKNRKRLIGKFVTVKYQELSDDGIPRFPSAVSIRDYE